MIISCLHEGFSGGIGDFLRGSLYLKKYADSIGVNFGLNFKNHPIGEYIKSNSDEITKTIIDLETYKHQNKDEEWHKKYPMSKWHLCLKEALHKLLEEEDYNLNVSSYYHESLHIDGMYMLNHLNDYKIDKKLGQFFMDNINFSNEVTEYAYELLDDIKFSKYNIIHLRMGDLNSWETNFKDVKIPDKYKDNINFRKFDHSYKRSLNVVLSLAQDDNTIILSDNNSFKDYVQNQKINNLKVSHTCSAHSSLTPGLLILNNSKLNRNNKDLFYVAVDMFLLTKANRVNAYSVYDWGSGFPYWISMFYGVPVKLYKLQAEPII